MLTRAISIGFPTLTVFCVYQPSPSDMPTTIVRQIAEAENSVRGDTSGKVMKKAKLVNGTEIKVADFIAVDEWIEIDTRTGEYRSRAKAPE